MASDIANPKPGRARRRTIIILLTIGIFLTLTLVFSQAAFNLTFLRPTGSGQTLILAALSALIFCALVLLTFVLLRTLLKLYAEQKGGVLGSKFRTKMVLGALVLSLAPVIFLFLFAYGLMNRSIDKWFSRPVEQLREDTATVATMLSNYALENAYAEAQSLANSPEIQQSFSGGNFSGVLTVFRRREPSLQGGFALALEDGYAQAVYQAPEPWQVLKTKLPLHEGRVEGLATLGNMQYVVRSAPVGSRGWVVVGLPLPKEFSRTMAQIDASQQWYWQLSQQRKAVRRTYMGLLLLLTVLVLFAATWFALFLSKFVTRPVAALAEATQEISRGRLDYRVAVPASDELGRLVRSFNRMAEELETSRKQIENSSHDLTQANSELEQRRGQMETILESIPTGVLSLDADLQVTHTNYALARIFRPDAGSGTAFPPGSTLAELFPAEMVEDLDRLLRKADRMGTTTAQMEIPSARQTLNLAVTIASLQHGEQRLGYVIVFEDLSDLLQAQKQAAWREVARRVAHEIKNPLTPIALSAERIRRYLDRSVPLDDASLAVLHGCAETIAGAVETVRTLVDEFSTLARFPTMNAQPADINRIVEGALGMFEGRLQGVRVETSLAADLPRVLADAEAIKRAVANLVDNAAEAMHDSLVREIHISTALVESRDAVEVVVADTGPGVTHEVKEKLFLPYFSTKRRGTGLGLAIVSRIVEEHKGSIRVEKNLPAGTRFVVELPLAPETVSPSPAHA